MATLILFIRFVLAFRITFFSAPDTGWNVVRLWVKGNPHPLVDISYLDGGPHKGHWSLSLTDSTTFKISHCYTDANMTTHLNSL
jgi:hypothetical protein